MLTVKQCRTVNSIMDLIHNATHPFALKGQLEENEIINRQEAEGKAQHAKC